jgi:hypothetical protein
LPPQHVVIRFVEGYQSASFSDIYLLTKIQTQSFSNLILYVLRGSSAGKF